MLFGLDIHPSFQAGLSIPQVKKEGFEFIICKLSQGTGWSNYNGSIPWINQARSLGMDVLGYHYLNNGNPEGQAEVFCKQLRAAGCNGAIDAEKGSGDIINVRAFHRACVDRGAKIPLLYLPRWYWQQIGSPGLAGLPPLWSSHYPDMTVGTAAQNYGRVPKSFWTGYGGLPVSILQYSSTARVAGHTVDVNAFNGDKTQLSALFGHTPVPATTQGFLMSLSDAEQAEVLGLLRTIDAQLRGIGAKGWPSLKGGTGKSLTVVDYLRENNVRVEDLARSVAQVHSEPTFESVSIDAITAAVTSAVTTILNNVRVISATE